MTIIDFYTGIITYNDNIPMEEVDEFNETIIDYSQFTKIVPNTWELIKLCLKDGHLRRPTLEEFKSVPIITEEITDEDYAIWKYSEITEKKETFISKIFNIIGDIIFILVCIILPPIALIILFFGY